MMFLSEKSQSVCSYCEELLRSNQIINADRFLGSVGVNYSMIWYLIILLSSISFVTGYIKNVRYEQFDI